MISAYSISDGLLRKLDCSVNSQELADATWVDLLEPTKEQEMAVESAVGIEISLILSGRKLVTLRYGDPAPFRNFFERAEREPAGG